MVEVIVSLGSVVLAVVVIVSLESGVALITAIRSLLIVDSIVLMGLGCGAFCALHVAKYTI